MQSNILTTLSETSKSKLSIPRSIIVLLILLLARSNCFSQSNKTGKTMKTDIKQEERIVALEKRIAEAGDDFVSLTAEEYDFLLSQPIGAVEDFDPLTTTASGIMVGIGFAGNGVQQAIQTLFQKIPNLGEGDVFVIFDFVKDNNGLDFLRRKERSIFDGGGIDEIEADESTQLRLDIRTAGSKSYWFGSRDVQMGVKTGESLFEYRSFSDMNSGTASGKVVMYLPTNITGLALGKEDIGVEKPFAGGVMTLKEIKDDYISFEFTGKDENIYAWTLYDDTNTVINIDDIQINDGLYMLYSEHPQSVKVYQAEIVRQEYPFTFEQRKKPAPEPLLKGIDAARFSAAMFFQTQLLQPTNAVPVYLDINDPITISIKVQAVTNMRQSARYMDPESPESKLVETQEKALSEEKKNQLLAISGQIIADYTAQTLFDIGTFICVFASFKEMDQIKIPEEWELRVQNLGGNKYIAELWEDSYIVHPEAKNEISENERYYKMMALLYTIDNDGAATFINPFQPSIDFLKKNSK